MSKKIIAANEQQGIPTPTTIPKRAALVNKIRLRIKHELLTPVDHAADMIFDLAVILSIINDLAKNESLTASDRLRIEVLAKTSIGITDAIGEALYVTTHEKGPAILAAVGGES